MTDLCPAAVDATHWKRAQAPTIAEASLILLKEKRLCDVVFSFENSESRIEAHQLFLRARSPVFDSMLRGRGSSDGTREVNIDDTTPERFQELLEFIYGDKFESDFAGALDILHLAHKYRVEPLIMKCKEVLLTGLQFEDALEVFQTANELGNLDDLKQTAGNIIARSLYAVYEDKTILNRVEKDTLVYLLSLEQLPMTEVDLFKLALRWGRSHFRGTTDDEALKTILAEILPLLRYTTMTAKEFTTVVVPTQLLSPKETVDVYSYLCGDSAIRRELSGRLPFNTVPRQRPQGVVVFIHEEGSGSIGESDNDSGVLLTESLSFRVTPRNTIEQGTSPEEKSKKLAITGIIVQWPGRSVLPISSAPGSVTLKFHIGLLSYKGEKICKTAIDSLFPTTTKNCSPGKVVEVPVTPPMEISHPQGFAIVVADQSDNYCRKNPGSSYRYSWQTELQELKNSVHTESENVVVELTGIQRNTDICRFPDNVYGHVRTVRGIRIASV